MKYLLALILLVSFCFGQLTFTAMEEFEYDKTMGWRHDVVAMNDSIFIVIYGGGSTSDAILKSYECDADGTNITMLDSVTVDVNYTVESEIIKISATRVMVMTADGGAQQLTSWVFDGNWDATVVDTYVFPDMEKDFNLVPHYSDDDKAVIFAGTSSLGYVALIDWDSGTGANIAQIDLEFYNSGSGSLYSRGIAINDSLYAVTYSGTSGDPYVHIFNMGVNFTNVVSVDRQVLHNQNQGTNIAYVDQTHALAWYTRASQTTSYWETVSWTSGSGANVTEVNAMSEPVPTGFQKSPGELLLDATSGYYIFFREYNSLLNARSYVVDGSYNITANSDSTRFSMITPYPATIGGVYGSLMNAETGLYILIYTENGTNDGYLQTITAFGSSGWAHKVMGVETPTVVNSATEFTKISGVE